jgi:hypothetical protein
MNKLSIISTMIRVETNNRWSLHHHRMVIPYSIRHHNLVS